MSLMQKRGQIAIFLIIGVVLLILVGIFYSLAKYSVKSASKNAVAENTKPSDADIVKAYAISCLKMVSDDALFNRIGLQGGFIEPAGAPNYQENELKNPESQIVPAYVSFTDGIAKNVPLYLSTACNQGSCAQTDPLTGNCIRYKCIWSYAGYFPDPSYLPSSTVYLDKIAEKISNYVEVEFPKCFNRNSFNDIDIQISASLPNPIAETKINKNDVIVHIDYPLSVRRGSSELKLDSFEVRLPIRILSLYQNAMNLINDVKLFTAETDTAEAPYTINNCATNYGMDGNTNLNVADSGVPGIKIVRFRDYSTFFNNYFKTYTFQVAVKGVNFNGNC